MATTPLNRGQFERAGAENIRAPGAFVACDLYRLMPDTPVVKSRLKVIDGDTLFFAVEQDAVVFDGDQEESHFLPPFVM